MLIGHKKIWEFLKNSAQLERVSHAYLFCGQEKLGKKTLALKFAKMLLGSGSGEQFNPDLILIEPDGSEIKISQIREMAKRFSLKSYFSSFKIAIIDQAHCMNQEAQTSLLKILEEPKGKSVLILTTEYPERLFPTILSRVQKIKFYPVKKNEIEKYLKEQKIEGQRLEELTRVSLGKPGELITYISDTQKLEELWQKTKELKKVINSDLNSRFRYAKDLSDEPKNIKEILGIWLRCFREVFISRAKLEIITLNGVSDDDFGAQNYSLKKLRKIIKLIQDTNFIISNTNTNTRLSLERLMLEL
ncbi:ATP-binding protein [Patescibacteria group bacterium]